MKKSYFFVALINERKCLRYFRLRGKNSGLARKAINCPTEMAFVDWGEKVAKVILSVMIIVKLRFHL